MESLEGYSYYDTPSGPQYIRNGPADTVFEDRKRVEIPKYHPYPTIRRPERSITYANSGQQVSTYASVPTSFKRERDAYMLGSESSPPPSDDLEIFFSRDPVLDSTLCTSSTQTGFIVDHCAKKWQIEDSNSIERDTRQRIGVCTQTARIENNLRQVTTLPIDMDTSNLCMSRPGSSHFQNYPELDERVRAESLLSSQSFSMNAALPKQNLTDLITNSADDRTFCSPSMESRAVEQLDSLTFDQAGQLSESQTCDNYNLTTAGRRSADTLENGRMPPFHQGLRRSSGATTPSEARPVINYDMFHLENLIDETLFEYGPYNTNHEALATNIQPIKFSSEEMTTRHPPFSLGATKLNSEEADRPAPQVSLVGGYFAPEDEIAHTRRREVDSRGNIRIARLPARKPVVEYDLPAISDMTVTQLKSELKRYSLPAVGKKTALQDRLSLHLQKVS